MTHHNVSYGNSVRLIIAIMSRAKIRENIDWIRGNSGFHPREDVKFMGMKIYFNCIFVILEKIDFKNLIIYL